MTIRAREVLEDCRQALAEIQDGVMGRQWRIRWVAAVTLLRTVGYVLKDVDAAMDPRLKKAIDGAWARLNNDKPEPHIFWDFIDAERHHIIHQYQIGAGQGVTIRPGAAHINARTGEQRSEPGLPTLYHYVINTGPYQGKDQREVIQEAIRWWDDYLSAIEEAWHKAET